MNQFIVDDNSRKLEFMHEPIFDVAPSIKARVCTDHETAAEFLTMTTTRPNIIQIDAKMLKLSTVEVLQKITSLHHLIATRINNIIFPSHSRRELSHDDSF